MSSRAWPSTPARDAVRLVLWVSRGPRDPMCVAAYREAGRRGGGPLQSLLGAVSVVRAEAAARRTPENRRRYAAALKQLAVELERVA